MWPVALSVALPGIWSLSRAAAEGATCDAHVPFQCVGPDLRGTADRPGYAD
jgi:hypothetical protein